MKIYTRTGDLGETGLFGGARVPKDDVRVDAFGEVDELNALLGLCVTELERVNQQEIAGRLLLLQGDLFAIGANLATPAPADGGRANSNIPPLPTARVASMEAWIDEAEDEISPLRNFILPGGSESAARLHFARTVCRRAERRVTTLARDATIEASVGVYLNRLSDLLFTLARLANHRSGREDVPWAPNLR